MEELKRISGRSYVVLVWLELQLPLWEKMSLPLFALSAASTCLRRIGSLFEWCACKKLHVKIIPWNGEKWGRRGTQVERFRNVIYYYKWKWHLSCWITYRRKPLQHHEKVCIIIFFSPYRGNFSYMPCLPLNYCSVPELRVETCRFSAS